MISPVPEGFQALIPYLVFHDCAKAMEFYKTVFKAEEISKMAGPDGKKIMHAEMKMAGCVLFMGDECPESGGKSPKGQQTVPVSMTLYCLDAEMVFQRALKHGAKSVREVTMQFWGDKMGSFVDPFGHHWTLLQRVKEMTPAEMEKAGKKAMKEMAGKA